ncbi:MAG: disulfide oxidoreductase [Alphaproteobacteria bacterium]|nr:disulfide oxidoreductase [Alphaproteobacteria bacterium]
MQPFGGRVLAVLGPTNTGKTHLAVERLLGHGTGIIGLPLRLLAREIYDRVAAAKGAASVALVTGEEKILPPGATHFVCTVESMPADRGFDFLAVDEIQLAADPERGHVFTDRILHARGRQETMLLGAETIRSVLRHLIPEAEFVARPRLSTLRYAGHRKLARLDRRSAVVAFSADDVYAIAEVVRRQRGGAAVVLGALSPRTRNAQVDMFESGEVDFLVATDAIGMGLNLHLENVAFAATSKFDGAHQRKLYPPEVGQIAGRAGRHLTDGWFSTTGRAPEFEPEMIERVENHRFDQVRAIFWRNSALHFASPQALLDSLEELPPQEWRKFVLRPRRALDQQVFETLSAAREIRGSAAVRLLWDVCQIPDYRKTMTESHTRLLGRIHDFLAGPDAMLPTQWLADHVARIDRTDGDIDTLAARIAHIRTWTYVCHRAGWLRDALHWQGRTREIEDRLSDALHERLTQRFVDRRSAVLSRKLGDSSDLLSDIGDDGVVSVEGHPIGRLEGFRFVAEVSDSSSEARMLRTAAQRSLRPEIRNRATKIVGEPDDAFVLDASATLLWRGAPVAHLQPGPTARTPRLVLADGDLLEGAMRIDVETRLDRWLDGHLAHVLGPLDRLIGEGLTGTVRGVAFQLHEGLGLLPRSRVAEQVTALSHAERKALGARGVRLGAHAVFVPSLLKARPAALGALLWAVHHRLTPLPQALPPGRVSLDVDPALALGYYQAGGYLVFASRAIRVDMIERLAATMAQRARKGPVALSPDLYALVACSRQLFEDVVLGIGFRRLDTEAGPAFVPVPVRRPHHRRARPPQPVENSPFAALSKITPRRGA